MDIARSARVGNRFSSLVAGGLALVVTLAAAASPTPHTAVTSDKGVLSGVSADSPADAWAAGGPGSTLMLHWTGSSWAQTAVPAGDNLFSVSADLHASRPPMPGRPARYSPTRASGTASCCTGTARPGRGADPCRCLAAAGTVGV